MLELIMLLSVVLGKFSDLAVVSALLVINAVLTSVVDRLVALRFGVEQQCSYTFSFLMLLYFAVFSVVSAREPSWFWATLPSKPFLAALVADTVTGTVLTRMGLPGLMPLPWWQTLAIFLYAMVSCLVLNDAVKVTMIKWRVPNAVAKTRVDVRPPIIKRA